MQLEGLDSIAVRHLCDKALVLPGRNGHGYAQHYERFFCSLTDLPIRLVEIGVDKGASLRMWSEYFSRATIFGVDINPECQNSPAGRATVVIGDQSKPEFWESFTRAHGSNWDIVVDDGGHYADQIITTFRSLWPHLRTGGFYCVEDMGTAYPHYTQGRIQCTEVYMANCVPDGWTNHKEFFLRKVDEINLGNEIEFAFFSKELAVLKKL